MTTRTSGALRRARAGAVLAGALAGVAGWAVLHLVVGIHQPVFGPGRAQALPVAAVAVAGLAGGLLGWGTLALAERLRPGRRRSWLAVALAGLLASLGAPLSGHGIGPTDRAGLVLLHLSVAAVALPLLYRSAQPAHPHRAG